MEKVKSSNVEVRQAEEMSIVRDNKRLRVYQGSVSIDRFLVPGEIYEFNYDSGGCLLDICEDFSFPDKIYDLEKIDREQILKTFKSQNKNVGVLYEGYTLTASS